MPRRVTGAGSRVTLGGGGGAVWSACPTTAGTSSERFNGRCNGSKSEAPRWKRRAGVSGVRCGDVGDECSEAPSRLRPDVPLLPKRSRSDVPSPKMLRVGVTDPPCTLPGIAEHTAASGVTWRVNVALAEVATVLPSVISPGRPRPIGEIGCAQRQPRSVPDIA
eukprot:2283989-Rhodomonas_salina.1